MGSVLIKSGFGLDLRVVVARVTFSTSQVSNSSADTFYLGWACFDSGFLSMSPLPSCLGLLSFLHLKGSVSCDS